MRRELIPTRPFTLLTTSHPRSLGRALHCLVGLALALSAFPLGAQNLLLNPGFDNGSTYWGEITNTGHYRLESMDAGGSYSSYSMSLYTFGSVDRVEVGQCLSVQSLATYRIGGKVYIQQAAITGEIGVGARFFDGPGCTGGGQFARIFYRDSFPIGAGWVSLDWKNDPIVPPSATRSVQFYLFFNRTSGGNVSVMFDDLYLREAGPLGSPPSAQISASPREIRRGESTRLIWRTEDATSVVIDGGVGSQPVDGSVEVSPSSPTTYTLTATGPGGTTTARTSVDVRVDPRVVVTAQPAALVQGTSSGGATSSYVLTNVGGSSTQVSLTQAGDFFTQSPTSFTLEPGQSQRVMITSLQRDTGAFEGGSFPAGNGIPEDVWIPIRLLSVPTPDGPTAAEPETPRVDVVGGLGANPTGTATFRNTGQARIQGTLVATERWLRPEEGLIEVDPGETVQVSFEIDRAQRPLSNDLGSLEGQLRFVFRTGPSGKQGLEPENGADTTSSLVTVVDTATPPVSTGSIPPLAQGEVALFIPGAGHVQGGAGLFFSDISLANVSGGDDLDGIQLFYTPLGDGAQTLSTTVSNLASNTPLPLADVARTVFDAAGTLGSLQIRAPNVDQLSVNANILLRSNDEGQKTFGNTIPALRSDRSVGPGESFYLTGLTSTATSRTNLFIQETSGGAVTADIEFFDESGQKLGERNGVEVSPFRLEGIFHSDQNPSLPFGAVSAVITSRGESSGRFAAYATPVDAVSGDSWSLVDWNAQSGFAGTEEMVVPVAGALQGGGGLKFETDFAAINRGESQATALLTYITRLGEGRAPIERSLTIGPGQSIVLEDVTTSLFNVDPSQFTLGFLKVLPQSGAMTVTSRNFATEGGDPGTFGTGVATLPASAAMRLGDVRRLGGVKDASLETIQSKTPGSFRSNFGMMETSGEGSVTIRVTVHFTYSGPLAVARGSGTREYTLQPNEFVQLSRISREVLGDSRDDFGDFDNLQIEFAVVDGGGAAVVFVSSVENDSGDSILRVP